MKVTIIGAGVLGTSLGILLHRAGHEIAALCSLNRRSAQEAAAHIGGCDVIGDPGLAVPWARMWSSSPCRTGRFPPSRSRSPRAVPSSAVRPSSTSRAACPRGSSRGYARPAGTAEPCIRCRASRTWTPPCRMLPETYFFIEGDEPTVEVMRDAGHIARRHGRSRSMRATRRSITPAPPWRPTSSSR